MGVTDDRTTTPAVHHDARQEQLDRNWNEILQELRVTQTGTQILTGFLLTLAFQPRFKELDAYHVDVYLALVIGACITTALALAPVSLHRILFRQGAKTEIVHIANVILKFTLAGVAAVLVGVTLLIFDVVIGRTAGLVAGGVTLTVVLLAWLLVPVLAHPKRDRA